MQPLGALLYSANGVVITLTYFLLPFAVLPIYGSLRSVSDVTMEAARDVGARPLAVVRDVVLPQCQGGLMTAFTLSFLISAGDYVTPALRRRRLGADRNIYRKPVLDRLQLAARQRHGVHHDGRYPARRAGRALLPRVGFAAMKGRKFADLAWAAFAILVAVYLLLPLVLVVLFSFNSSALTSLPLTGLTLDWYRRLYSVDYFWPALQNSLVVALAVGSHFGHQRHHGRAGACAHAEAAR